jgi:Ca2+-binding EF-hand superfamily protein
MMDKNKDRQVTEAEFNTYWKTRFDDTDSDQNGDLSKKELHADPLFNHLDTDRSQTISFLEYLKEIKPHFTEHDQNGDGFLKKGEIWN